MLSSTRNTSPPPPPPHTHTHFFVVFPSPFPTKKLNDVIAFLLYTTDDSFVFGFIKVRQHVDRLYLIQSIHVRTEERIKLDTPTDLNLRTAEAWRARAIMRRVQVLSPSLEQKIKRRLLAANLDLGLSPGERGVPSPVAACKQPACLSGIACFTDSSRGDSLTD